MRQLCRLDSHCISRFTEGIKPRHGQRHRAIGKLVSCVVPSSSRIDPTTCSLFLRAWWHPLDLRWKDNEMRTLIVEDDFTSRLLLQTFLSRYGECHVTINGKEAVEAFHLALEDDNPYDLICMDIMMPEMDGKAAVREIRELEEAQGILSTSGAKIIMITALDDVKNVAASFGALCDAYVLKPLDIGQLVSHLKAFALIAPDRQPVEDRV